MPASIAEKDFTVSDAQNANVFSGPVCGGKMPGNHHFSETVPERPCDRPVKAKSQGVETEACSDGRTQFIEDDFPKVLVVNSSHQLGGDFLRKPGAVDVLLVLGPFWAFKGIQPVRVGCTFHPFPIVHGNRGLWHFNEQSPGKLQTPEVGIDASEARPFRSTYCMPSFIQQLHQIALFGHEYQAARIVITRGPRSLVPMQPADPLQQNVSRTQVRDQDVRIDIQALLQSLGSDQQKGTGWRILAKQFGDSFIQYLSVFRGEPAMVGTHLTFAFEEGLIGDLRAFLHGPLQGDNPGDGIQDYQYTRACSQSFCDFRD
jgi:hypothetical protein